MATVYVPRTLGGTLIIITTTPTSVLATTPVLAIGRDGQVNGKGR